MIENQKLMKESNYKRSLGINRKSNTKIFLKNQQNPYQMNFYADEKPQCEFI